MREALNDALDEGKELLRGKISELEDDENNSWEQLKLEEKCEIIESEINLIEQSISQMKEISEENDKELKHLQHSMKQLKQIRNSWWH